MKNKVYESAIANMDELKMKIENEIGSISKKTLCDVFSNISKRMNFCISVDGNHFEHLL